ncbi:MAG: cysteine desulfurase [Chloroflexota bacterium]|nr:cysteine desulfurase [Chloroflexota bacterium]
MQRPVYLDYNATTPIDPEVVEAMLPFLAEHFGNASSMHEYGYFAHEAVERARGQVAALLGARPSEIVFTAGGSETDNLAIKGAVFQRLERRPHVVSTTAEHPAVLNTLQYLRRRFGVHSTLLPVDQHGLITPDQVRAALRLETVLITVMHANNEVGTVQPIGEIGAVAREAGVLFHVDAAQSAGKLPIDVAAMKVDMVTIAGHKVYGPKGVGALYLRHGTQIDPLVHGSGQEHGLRAGTENVAAIVGLGTACAIAADHQPQEEQRLTLLRDKLHALLADAVPHLALNGHPTRRLPNTLNVSLCGALGQAVLASAPDVAASTGSACHAGASDPSPVLMAMGLPAERALSALRLSLGRWTSEEEIERAAAALIAGYTACAGTLSPA